MHKFCVPAVAAACLFAIPAFAATPATTPTTGTSAKAAPEAAQVQQVQQDLHQDLTKAGYTDIQIVPGSFLVRAKDKKGNETEMMISPHSMTEVTAMNSSGGSVPTAKSETGTSKGASPSVAANK